MKRILTILLFVLALAMSSFAQTNPPLRITEVDGSPSKTNVTRLNFPNGTLTISGGTATYAAVGGSGLGDVVGPGSSTDNAAVRFDATTGKLVQNSVVIIGDTGNVTGLGTLNTHTIPGGTSTFTIRTDDLSVFGATTSAQLAGVISNETGSSLLVFNTSPTLVTPVLGVATATSINKVTITQPATGATLTIPDGVTLNAGAGGTLGTGAFQPTGATTTLNNLGTTSINADLIFAATTRGLRFGAGTSASIANIVGYTANVGPRFVDDNTTSTLTFNVQSLSASRTVTWQNNAGSVVLAPAAGAVLIAGPTAARTVTFPDDAFTAARTDAANTFTGVQGMTSPALTTSLTTPSTTFALVNATATTINFAGAATTLNIGAAATTILNFGGSTTAAEFRFLEPSGSGTNYSAFKAVAQAGNITYSLPPSLLAGGVLTDVAGDGVLTWAAGGGGGITAGTTAIASGTATRLVYETSGNKFGEISGATSDGTSVTFGSGNLLATSPVFATDITTPLILSGSAASGGNIRINTTTNGTKGLIQIDGTTAGIGHHTGSNSLAFYANSVPVFGVQGVTNVMIRSDGAYQINQASGIDNSVGAGLSLAAQNVLVIGSGAAQSRAGWLQWSGQARMTADATNATTTFSNLTGLTISNLQAGRKYTGTMRIKCNNSVSIDGAKFDFNGGSATMTSFWAAASAAAATAPTIGANSSTSLAGVINYTAITGETYLEFSISFVVNGAGTLIPRIATNSVTTGVLTVELGSFVMLNDSPN